MCRKYFVRCAYAVGPVLGIETRWVRHKEDVSRCFLFVTKGGGCEKNIFDNGTVVCFGDASIGGC